MPLEDKLRLECVSKQFQRTVFVKQYSLTLKGDAYLGSNSNYLKSIESVLKKCPNVQLINKSYLGRDEIHKNIIQFITKYCNHLIEFNGFLFISHIERNEPEFKEFLEKFGSKLEQGRKFSNWEEFTKFPNLQTLFIHTYDYLDRILQLNSKQVNRLEFDVYEEEEYKFREVLQKFHEIRHLTLRVKIYSQNSIFNRFKDSPLLQNLIQLGIYANVGQNVFINSLEQMAKKFPNLKKIDFIFGIILEKISDFEELMSSLKAFPHLKRLDIGLILKTGLAFDKIFSFKHFPQQLTHLSLDFMEHPINASVLKEIDIYLPKLQYLFIRPKILTDEEGMTQMSDILSRLSFLQTIDLRLNYANSELMDEKINEKCRKIQKCLSF